MKTKTKWINPIFSFLFVSISYPIITDNQIEDEEARQITKSTTLTSLHLEGEK